MKTTDEMYAEKNPEPLRARYTNAYTGSVTVRDPEYTCQKCGKTIKGNAMDPAGPERCPRCGAKEWFW